MKISMMFYRVSFYFFFTSDQKTKILGNYTVLTDRLVLDSSKFVWEGESPAAALLNSQYS